MTRRGSIKSTAALLTIAVAAALVPLRAEWVERWFSRGVYPIVQGTLTRLSNPIPIALLDVAAILLIVALIVATFRGLRAGLILFLKTVALTYLLFLAFWGLNYRRVPLEQKLDFDAARVVRANAMALAAEGVRRVNALYTSAHATTYDRTRLATAFTAAEHAMDGDARTHFARPKRSLLGFYFRKAAIDGMTDPIFLEVILNPDLVDVEVPEVLAHEWAHLAGYADESEASFLAWLTCLRGDPLAQYSGWLAAYQRAAGSIPRELRGGLPPLDEGPRSDLRAIAARVQKSSPLVRDAARGAYDSYLKANRIEEGIQNYDAVIKLMLGTSLGRDWSPATKQ